MRLICSVLAVLLFSGCTNDREKLFRLVSSSESGIHFSNNLTETPAFNILNYLYFYNGGGVAAGDVNGDSLQDIYFTSNQEENRLYINQGGLKFKDVTELSGVAGFRGWTTGVTMADVNGDGRLDIYVGYLGDYLIYKGKNQLFINEGNDENGIPRFSDQAREYGLDLIGFSTQAAFFDYDRDGDLDMFMLNHSVHDNGTYGKSTLRKVSHPLAGDKLMRNDNGKFVDVTEHSGIYSSVLGYGLGVVVSDVNMDGWPDIYAGNDFHENDYLYLNQQDGTFSEVLEKQFAHTSRYTMGVDFADFNNDAFPDLMAVDMLPENPHVLKASVAEDPYDIYNFKIRFGYNHQFARNTLQLNNQNGTFSDLALMANVAATDWSWSTFFADFDLDGNKDIFVANGIYRRSNDLDYINFISSDSIQMRLMGEEIGEEDLRYVEKMPSVPIANYLFHNNGDSTFTNRASSWGLDQLSFSQGAAYSDLDNDGDLDLVINNLNAEAFLYENLTIDRSEDSKRSHFLRITLKGKPGNTSGIGAKAFVHANGKVQMQECMPTRGYQSSVDHRLSFGMGTDLKADSVLVVWSDGTFQRLINVKADREILFDQSEASGLFDYKRFHQREPLFAEASDSLIPYVHKENSFVEFNREALIPHMLSAEGPAVAVGDINGDSLDDIFIAGSKRVADQVFIQTLSGTFTELKQPIFKRDSTFEDVDAMLFDADRDGDNDLLLVPGGNEFTAKSKYRRPRLHINDGKGNFSASQLLPEIYLNGSCAALSDFDNDGDLDIFLGGRSVPWHYGFNPDSYLLSNDGNGKYTDITDKSAPDLRTFAMVKSAVWADIDGDGDTDLVVAAEWQRITIFVNDNNKLKKMQHEESGLDNSSGWWNTLYASDVDGDGDTDFIAGNLGLNSKLKASHEHPVRMFVGDIDKNDSTDQIISYHFFGDEYPFHTRDELTKQLPFLKKRYLSYQKFAGATLYDMFNEDRLKNTSRFEVQTFQSAVIENLGKHKFRMIPLPKAAQLSTVNTIISDDFDNDGKADFLLAGNFFPVNIQMGRNDASYGLVLGGTGSTRFTTLPAYKTGLSVNGEVRHLRKIKIKDKDCILAVRNNDTVKLFTINRPSKLKPELITGIQ